MNELGCFFCFAAFFFCFAGSFFLFAALFFCSFCREDIEDALAAFLMSVRMIRAGFFAPVYMLVFWLVYHRWQKRDARL